MKIAGVPKFGRRGLIANQLGRNDASVRITSPAWNKNPMGFY